MRFWNIFSVCLLLVSLLLAQPASIQAAPRPKVKNVKLLRSHWCVACHTVIEEFQKFMVLSFLHNTTGTQQYTPQTLPQWFCKRPPFDRFQKGYQMGCMKTLIDHYQTVLEPYLGTRAAHEFSSNSKTFKHRLDACAKIDACDTPVAPKRPKDDCEACLFLNYDLWWSLNREEKVNVDSVQADLQELCLEVPMRHEKPDKISDFCFNLIEDHRTELQPYLQKVFNDDDIVYKEEHMQKYICGHMTNACPQLKKQWDEEVKKEQQAKEAKEAKAAEEKAKSTPTLSTSNKQQETVKIEL